MKTKKIMDLTVEELQVVIADTVNIAMRDSVEDILALSSNNYLKSIKEAREDYKKGRVKSFEETFDV
ncbi:MAG: hypothetical protein ACYDDE_07110 [bacterium]